MLQFHVLQDSKKGSDFVARMMYEYVINQPTGVLGLATGNTFISIYQQVLELLQQHQNIDLSQLSTCNLDDYIVDGLSISNQDLRSFKYYMKKHFFSGLEKLGFNTDSALFPADVYPQNKKFFLGAYLTKFDEVLAAKGGIDIQFVGLGPKESPHVAFCQEGFSIGSEYNWLEYPSYITEVDLATRLANRFNSGCDGDMEKVPAMAATMSTGTLYKFVNKTYVLVAFGDKKSVVNACFEPPNDKIPATIIQMLDRKGIDCHVVCDYAAAKGLENYISSVSNS